MDTKLNGYELSALQSLDSEQQPSGASYREGDLPKRLFDFNLVRRQPSGTTVLTKYGERALFRKKCLSALAAMERGEASALANGVEKWLLSSGFVEVGGADKRTTTITKRGRLWLASFEEDEIVVAPSYTAGDFALRRLSSR